MTYGTGKNEKLTNNTRTKHEKNIETNAIGGREFVLAELRTMTTTMMRAPTKYRDKMGYKNNLWLTTWEKYRIQPTTSRQNKKKY